VQQDAEIQDYIKCLVILCTLRFFILGAVLWTCHTSDDLLLKFQKDAFYYIQMLSASYVRVIHTSWQRCFRVNFSGILAVTYRE
jgi:hypothetical protein